MTLEELQEKYLAECEKTKTLTEENNNLKTTNEKLNEDNKRLVDYNNKLFMRVTTPTAEEQPAKVLTPEEQEEEQIKAIRKLMEEQRK